MNQDADIISMHRSTTLQRAGFSMVVPVFIAFFYFNVDLSNYSASTTIMSYIAIALTASIIFLISNKFPYTQIFFDLVNGEIRYYRFLLFPKTIPFSEIISIEDQTKTERRYTKGKSITIYITDLFIITSTGDYQISVWERAKIGEFKTKFTFAKNQFVQVGSV